GFSRAIRSALHDSSPPEVERRLAVANDNSWSARVAAMSALIDDALEKRSAMPQRWDQTLRSVYWRSRTRVLQLVAALAAVYLLVFQTNVIWWLASPLKVTAPPAPADAIVVFAGGVGESGRAGGGAQERLRQAIDLYQAGYARYLVLSSG